MIVGEGGCPPRYFLQEMGALEAQDYIDGLSRRQRPGWEQAREMMRVAAAAAGAKRFDFPLPWDKEGKEAAAPPTKEERAALARRAEAVARRLSEAGKETEGAPGAKPAGKEKGDGRNGGQ